MVDFVQKEINLICVENIEDLNRLEKIWVEYESCEAFNLKNNFLNIESQIEALKVKYFKETYT
jgi:hypothetical protein